MPDFILFGDDWTRRGMGIHSDLNPDFQHSTDVTPTECPLKNCDRKGNAACKEGCQFLLEEEEVMLKKVLINGKSESTTST